MKRKLNVAIIPLPLELLLIPLLESITWFETENEILFLFPVFHISSYMEMDFCPSKRHPLVSCMMFKMPLKNLKKIAKLD